MTKQMQKDCGVFMVEDVEPATLLREQPAAGEDEIQKWVEWFGNATKAVMEATYKLQYAKSMHRPKLEVEHREKVLEKAITSIYKCDWEN